MDDEDKMILGGAVIVFALLAWGGWYLISKDNAEWAAFSKAHACKLVGRTEGTVGTGFSGGKVVVVTTSGQDGYLCDDGVTYWRGR